MRVIDKLVEQWHLDMDCKTKIHDYIGVTLAEYDEFFNTNRVPPRFPHLADRWDPASGPVKPAKREA